MRYGVMNIPTVILFKNGREIDRKVGVMPGRCSPRRWTRICKSQAAPHHRCGARFYSCIRGGEEQVQLLKGVVGQKGQEADHLPVLTGEGQDMVGVFVIRDQRKWKTAPSRPVRDRARARSRSYHWSSVPWD